MIPLFDLKRQYASIQRELDGAALDVLHSGKYILGDGYKESIVRKFEVAFAGYIGVKYAVAVSSGTDALVIALRAAGVKKGDEVITCAMSFYATAEAIVAVGATPVFVDCTKDTHVINAELIEAAITSKTRAIIPIELYGYCPDMIWINKIADKYGLIVIEDAAQAAGASYNGKKAGALGHMGCFSFFPTKNLGCAGDGGIITTDNEDYYRLIRAYRLHGSGEDGHFAWCREKGVVNSNTIDFGDNAPKYFNFVIGYNSRLDEIQAALLLIKLKYLDEWNAKRIQHAKKYCKEIINPCIKLPVTEYMDGHVYYIFVIEIEEREKLRDYLKGSDIGTGVYFPVPLHLQMVFEDLGYGKGDMPNAEYLADHSLAIPVFPELTEEELDYIIQKLNEFQA